MTTPQSTCLRNDSSYRYRDLHGQRTAAEGRVAGVRDNQSPSGALNLASSSAVKRIELKLWLFEV